MKWTFEEQLRKIANNKVNTSALQGINQFSHLTFDQFAAKYLGEEEEDGVTMDAKHDVLMQPKQLRPRERLRKLPESFDWWDTPEMMPAVRDQEC